MQTRVEEDLLGRKEVPADAYYGIHTVRAVENFPIASTTISDIPDFIRGMVMVKKAAALANLEMGVLDKPVAEAIVEACDEILFDGRCLDQFPSGVFQGGAGTSVNMNTNEVVANLALERLGHPKGAYDVISPMDDVNRSQSTNDAYPTGFRLALWHALERLEPAIVALREACYDKSEEFREVLKMGRTQLQDAVPMSLGQEFGGFAVTMDEELHVLGSAARMLLAVNLGATAIGTGVNTPPNYRRAVIEHLRDVTGLPVTGAMNLIEATSDTGDYVNVHAALKRTAVKLSKICNDLRLLSSGPRSGLNEINLPELQAGSSIMPAKVNPVIPEVVNQVCFKVIGNDVTVTMDEELHVLGSAARMLLAVNLGATAIGTGVNTPPNYRRAVIEHLRDVTGLPVTGAMNLIEATSDTGDYVNVHAALKRTAVKLSKICNDLRLLSSGPRSGLNEINLPELQAGSSIMPAKVNPVIPEVVNQVCFKVIGNDVTVTMAAEGGQLQLNVMEPVIAQAMFESIDLLTSAMDTLTEKCVRGITANADATRADVMNSIGIVTYLNPIIGHHNGDLVGRECARSGRGVREVVLEMGLLTETELDDILSPTNLLRPRYKGKSDAQVAPAPTEDLTEPPGPEGAP